MKPFCFHFCLDQPFFRPPTLYSSLLNHAFLSAYFFTATGRSTILREATNVLVEVSCAWVLGCTRTRVQLLSILLKHLLMILSCRLHLPFLLLRWCRWLHLCRLGHMVQAGLRAHH